jgi:hypothetical protein
VYTLTFGGPYLKSSFSSVLGNSRPVVEVLPDDFNTTLFVDYTSWSDTNYVNKFELPLIQRDTNHAIKVGDSIRLPSSKNPRKVYSLTATGDLTVNGNIVTKITVNKLLDADVTSPLLLDVFVVSANTQYTVETVRDGEDAYVYDIYYTNLYVNDVPILNATICPTANFVQTGGMLYSVLTENRDQGGTSQIYTVTMTS